MSGETTLPKLTAPTTSAATNVTKTDFTANWSNVSTATGYELNIYTKETSTVATDLFFSEYVVGSSSNKYLEIYNGTGADVDLSDYEVLNFANGKETASNTEKLTGTLANGATFVIANAKATIYTKTPGLTSTVTYFNGNDAVALKKLSTDSYVDIIGKIGEDPGTAWTDGELSTKDKTLVRKPTVVSGVTANPISGFPTLSTEWEVYDKDDVSHLGSHSMTEGIAVKPIAGSPFTISDGATISHTVTGLDNSKKYYYTVRALRDTEKSDVSNETEVTLLKKPTGLFNNTLSTAEAWVNNGNILFNATAGELVEVFNIAGQKISTFITNDGVNTLTINAKGVIIIKINERTAKIIL